MFDGSCILGLWCVLWFGQYSSVMCIVSLVGGGVAFFYSKG